MIATFLIDYIVQPLLSLILQTPFLTRTAVGLLSYPRELLFGDLQLKDVNMLRIKPVYICFTFVHFFG